MRSDVRSYINKEERCVSEMLFSHKNDVQSVANGVCRRVKIRLHRFDISRSRSQNQWSLLL